jgi:hypothetical protein
MKCFIEVTTINNNVYRGLESNLTGEEIIKVNRMISDTIYKEHAQFNIERYTNKGRNKETIYFRTGTIESIKVIIKQND